MLRLDRIPRSDWLSIADEFLIAAFKPGMSVADLYEQYARFGDDPFIVPVDPNDAPVAYSAWGYAKRTV